jgi:hypothetical protein
MAKTPAAKKRRRKTAKTAGKKALRTRTPSVLEKNITSIASIVVVEKIISRAMKDRDDVRRDLGIRRLENIIGAISKKLESEFLSAMADYENHLRTKDRRANAGASRTWRMVDRYEKKYTMIKLVRRPVFPDQLPEYVRQGGHKKTFEYLVTRFPEEFPDDVVATARARLVKIKAMLNSDDETHISSSATPTA